jgi:hypothetical protein
VTSKTPGITVTSAPVTMATFAPGMAQRVSFTVQLDRTATGPIAGDFTIRIEAANGCTPALDVPLAIRLNVDDVPGASARDAFDASSVWQPSGAARWSQVRETALDRLWHGADAPGIADARLESPAVEVSPTAPFKVTFTHRFKFEYNGTALDGGVIEYSTDGGATWQDVSTLGGVSPGYSAVLSSQAGNPLGGRAAYVNQSAGYPATTSVTLDFGTHLAGMSVKLRFRIGTDQATGAPGWDIDDVSFEGITNTPFPVQVAESSVCEDGTPKDRPPPDELPGCCDAGPLRRGNVALVCVVLLLLVRRRRP